MLFRSARGAPTEDSRLAGLVDEASSLIQQRTVRAGMYGRFGLTLLTLLTLLTGAGTLQREALLLFFGAANAR